MKNIYAGYRLVTLLLLVALMTNAIAPTAFALMDSNANDAATNITSNLNSSEYIQSFKNKKKFEKVIYNNSNIEINFNSSIENNFKADWDSLVSINNKIENEYKQRALSVDAVTETDTINNIKNNEPSYMMALQSMSGVPNDTRVNDQWYLDKVYNVDGDIWKDNNTFKEKASINVKVPIVAVIDAGIDFNHVDLMASKWSSDNCVDDNNKPIGKCVGGYDFVNNDNDPSPSDGAVHGNEVAGLIGATTNNNTGIASLSGGRVKIMSLRAADYGLLDTNNVVRAVYFAVNNGATIINMSFAGPNYSQSFVDAIKYAADRNVTIVAAAGNSGLNLDQTPVYPASFSNSNVIAVGALGEDGVRTSWSNYGSRVMTLAAGARVLSTAANSNYDYVYGTSFAAPLTLSYILQGINSGLDAKSALARVGNVDGKTILYAAQPKVVVATSTPTSTPSTTPIASSTPTSTNPYAAVREADGFWYDPASKGGATRVNPDTFKPYKGDTLSATVPATPTLIDPGVSSSVITSQGNTITINSGDKIEYSWSRVAVANKYEIYLSEMVNGTPNLVYDCSDTSKNFRDSCPLAQSSNRNSFYINYPYKNGSIYRWNMSARSGSGGSLPNVIKNYFNMGTRRPLHAIA